jgi:hypothetical protein
LTYLASIPPGELNIHNLSQNLEIDHKTTQHYLTILMFEIGGKSKTKRQLKGASLPAYLVKDDILHPLKNEIPLFQCGFLS